jgi:hypothetical protein
MLALLLDRPRTNPTHLLSDIQLGDVLYFNKINVQIQHEQINVVMEQEDRQSI